MKKLMLVAAIMIITGGTVSAQTGAGQRGTNKNSPAYVDKNNDGICDNVGNGRGQGLGLRTGTNKNSPAYVDKNNDGICDNVGTGRGQGQGLRNGQGRGQNRSGNAIFSGRRGNGNCINAAQCQGGRIGRGR